MQSMVTPSRPELVIGLVGGTGARLSDLSKRMRVDLKNFGYSVIEIRLSELLEKHFLGWKPAATAGEAARLVNLQEMGTRIRRESNDGGILARAAIASIRQSRIAGHGNPDAPLEAHAYILHQLKHPAEVSLLRRVFGPAFVLFAGHASREIRANALATRMAQADMKLTEINRYRSAADSLISDDDKQDEELGQNTRDTYPLADFFTDLGSASGEMAVTRFIELLFGHPLHSPKYHEYAMYQASAVALRSSDENRQVGAAIVSVARNPNNKNVVTTADIIAVGANEVPRGSGGFYWDGHSPDYRDQQLIYNNDDRPEAIKIGALAELISRMRAKGWLEASICTSDDNVLANTLLKHLRGTQFMNLGEFSRPVHAEMAALLDSARRGVAVDGQTMFVTTFPCHNCAKHIIASGIRFVVYLEPYPKSRANYLHGEEMLIEGDVSQPVDGKVVFAAYDGVGPRIYQRVFSMSSRGAKNGKSLKHWISAQASLSPQYVSAGAFRQYIEEERAELEKLDVAVYSWDPSTICPARV